MHSQLSIWSFCLFSLCSLCGCFGRHLRLRVPATSPAARYVCTADKECEPASEVNPAALNREGTTFITLAAQCEGSIHEIIILEADSNEPTVDVTCAPREEALKTIP